MKKVFVSGCYDIIHGGHIQFFQDAKKYGDYLIVSFASDRVLRAYKKKKSSLPEEHKLSILKELEIVDEVYIADNMEIGLDFQDIFRDIKPDILISTEDDQFSDKKKKLCEEIGSSYLKLQKTLSYTPISTTDIINNIKTSFNLPLRVDFVAGCQDIPRYSQRGAFVINCSINKFITLDDWKVPYGAGLGGSALASLLKGENSFKSEMGNGVGWQDPAIVLETGLCIWRSGEEPVLEAKINPDFLNGKLAIWWTGQSHNSSSISDLPRNYSLIKKAGIIGKEAVYKKDIDLLSIAVDFNYKTQIEEGMKILPDFGEKAKKYCGSGWGGYALYIFDNNRDIPTDMESIEPYMRQVND